MSSTNDAEKTEYPKKIEKKEKKLDPLPYTISKSTQNEIKT